MKQLKTKLKSAFAPVHPPKAINSKQKAAKRNPAQPNRQWSRATSVSPSFAPPVGQVTTATSPTLNFLSRSSCARISFAARKRRPAAGPPKSSTSRFCVPYSMRPV